MKMPRVLLLFVTACLTFLLLANGSGREVALVAVDAQGQPLQPGSVTVQGKPIDVWKVPEGQSSLTFRLIPGVGGTVLPSGFQGPLYVRVSYLDSGYGRLKVRCRNAGGEWLTPDKATSRVLLDTGRIVHSYGRCAIPSPREAEISVGFDGGKSGAPAVTAVTVSAEPFADAHFQWLLDEPWKRNYTSPARPGIENGTLKGKVLVGYQGWFRTPNDPYDVGWQHWADFKAGKFYTDAWPDLSRYPAETLDKTEDVKTLGGQSGRLFSSAWPEVACLHFSQMREHGIAGALLQRFVSNRTLHSLGGGPEWVLGSVREAANREGRVWAVEYDVSGCPDDKLLEYIQTDWKWLIDQFGLRQDKSYAREGDKLVVAVWGMPFPDRGISAKTADAVLDFLKNDPQYGGNYVIGGVPLWWQTLPPEWQEHIRGYHGAISWQSSNYLADQAGFDKLGIDYFPQVWPGFSWANLKHLPTGSSEQYTPRDGGAFYEGLFSKALNAGANRAFVGMYDEFDEGTAILPMTDDPPATPTRADDAWGRFLTNEGRPSDWWLTLTGRWAKLLAKVGESQPVDSPVPFPAQEGLIAEPEKPFRQELCLNGRWQFQPVPIPGDYQRNTGQPPALTPPSPDEWDATPIKIPSPWNVNTWGNGRRSDSTPADNLAANSVYYPSYPRGWEGQEMGWLRRSLRVPDDWTGKRLVLHFEAIAGEAQVFVNGQLAGSHFDSFLPFEVDVTDLLKRDAGNELLVGVRKSSLFNVVSAGYPGNQRRTYPNGSNMDELVGIWGDVYLLGLPEVRVEDNFVQTRLDADELVAEVTLRNDGTEPRQVRVSGMASPWINLAGEGVAQAPVPKWKLGPAALKLPEEGVVVEPGNTSKVTLHVKVGGKLKEWSPNAPNLCGLVVNVRGAKGEELDRKYTRFGWRQFAIRGKELLLNGKPLQLFGDFSHPFGPFVLSRRHVWANYRMIKDFGGNMVRPHAQPMPPFWLDLADEMGLCVLDESAIFGSSIALNLKETVTWQRMESHVDALVRRDRNHPGVFGWSPGNEMFALGFHTEPAELEREQKLLRELALRTRKLDPTRDWISVDGDEDLGGTLPVWSRHMGIGLPEKLPDVDKPRMIGEHGGTYYAAPPLLAPLNGDRAFENYAGRNEALAFDVYRMIKEVARPKLTAFSASELGWFGLEQLPFGYRTNARVPTLRDGVFFPTYTEGTPGVQIERLPPYVATLNPGYDPALPLYKPLAMFNAMKAALEPRGLQPSPWEKPRPAIPRVQPPATNAITSVPFFGDPDGQTHQALAGQGVPLQPYTGGTKLLVIDGETLGKADAAAARSAADAVWRGGGLVWVLFRDHGAALANVAPLLPAPLEITRRRATSLVQEASHPVIDGFSPKDLYFAAAEPDPYIQKAGMGGLLAQTGKVLLTASQVNWRLFERQPETAKCGALLLDEHLLKPAGAALLEVPCGMGRLWVSTLDPTPEGTPVAEFWQRLWRNVGVALVKPPINWLVATGREAKTPWRYATADPAPGWEQPGFDESAWNTGPAGFGTPVPEGKPNTPWNTADIYLRHEFNLTELPKALSLAFHHDEDLEVYLNGIRVFAEKGHVSAYKSAKLDDAARQALRIGRNVLAVHCHQTAGGQFVDVGLATGSVPRTTQSAEHDLLLDGPSSEHQ